MMETYEARLNRLFNGWTDDEVTIAFEALRDLTFNGTRSEAYVVHDLTREYMRRSNYPDNVVCHRCGSTNHGTSIHDEHAS